MISLFFILVSIVSEPALANKAKAGGSHVLEALREVEAANYSEILEASEAKDLPRLRRAVNLFIKMFPESPLADDSLFWLGRLSTEKNETDQALFVLDSLLKGYPKSNRTHSAQVLKTVIYGKKGQWEKAEKAVLSALDARGNKK